MNLIAISGSLRNQSTNTTLLRSLQLLAPDHFQIVIYTELALLPPFNPDLEALTPVEAVQRLRGEISHSDGVLFSVPEYAHGLPGAFKNALDWLVGSGELYQKPVAIYNASSGATYARASLRNVLAALNVQLCEDAEVTINVAKKNTTPAEIAADAVFNQALRQSLEQLSVFLTHLQNQQ